LLSKKALSSPARPAKGAAMARRLAASRRRHEGWDWGGGMDPEGTIINPL
jgi:hypothetical protein